MATKREIRRSVRALLARMSSEERARQSAAVTSLVANDERFLASQRVGLYVSLEREVSTFDVLELCFARNKRVFVPKYAENSRRMDFFEVFSSADVRSLPRTRFGIAQPEEDGGRAEALSSGGLDVCLVPGVAFTLDGRRLGNGGGYYDHFLRRLRTQSPNCPLIGLAFTQQITDWLPTEEHDFTLDCIVFPK
jgi:5-formyltetrahydrofolate cyclo-ligase